MHPVAAKFLTENFGVLLFGKQEKLVNTVRARSPSVRAEKAKARAHGKTL
jgi:hypothetical protein